MEKVSLIEAKHESYLQIWCDRVRECRSSGKSVAEWCKANGVNIKTYYYWQKQVWDKVTQSLCPVEKTGDAALQGVQFAQVNLTSEDPGPEADIIIRKNAWILEVRNSVSPEILQVVLQAVTNNV